MPPLTLADGLRALHGVPLTDIEDAGRTLDLMQHVTDDDPYLSVTLHACPRFGTPHDPAVYTVTVVDVGPVREGNGGLRFVTLTIDPTGMDIDAPTAHIDESSPHAALRPFTSTRTTINARVDLITHMTTRPS